MYILTGTDILTMAAIDQDVAATSPTRDKGHAYVGDADDQSSLSSDETQAGVKNIEAISQTWTKWSLIAAYLGYINLFLSYVHTLFQLIIFVAIPPVVRYLRYLQYHLP